MVQAAQEVPTGHVIINVIHTLPGGLATGGISHPQKDAGDELNHQREGQCAAPHVSPARTPRDAFKENFSDVVPDTGPVVQPSVKLLDEIHAIERGSLKSNLILGIGLETPELNPNL